MENAHSQQNFYENEVTLQKNKNDWMIDNYREISTSIQKHVFLCKGRMKQTSITILKKYGLAAWLTMVWSIAINL